MKTYTRRGFLAQSSALAMAGLLPCSFRAGAEPPPEQVKIRFLSDPSICLAPQFLAMELLRQEGFTQIESVEPQPEIALGLVGGRGLADFTMWDAPGLLPLQDAGEPIVCLAGIHAGCWELFGNNRVQAIRDLKGKSVAVSALGTSEHVYLASMLAYVGIKPDQVNWLQAGSVPDSMRLFVEGKADAFLGFPPQPQALRAQKVGHVIVNTAEDKPWSQYFCCMIAANRDFVRKHPVVTKRVVRAMLKATDICAREPERAARFMVDKGYEQRYKVALEVVSSVPYARWREADPEDTLRFHALRLHEVGMVKTPPNDLVARGTDWRFLNELKKELKA
jgi:NitT/TauT family transport system substrate-binding protein